MADDDAPMDGDRRDRALDDEEEAGQVSGGRAGRFDEDEDEDMERALERDGPPPDGGDAGRPAGRARDFENKTVIEISDDDAAFILGKGGKTKEKLARVSGARIELYERSRTLEIMGPPDARARAKKYVEAVMAQRVGPVPIQEDDQDDLTVVHVPHEAVGFVTGAQGNFLRTIEEEWGTLMFFADYRGRRGVDGGADTEKLAIFGPRRGRRGAELKVMSAVETKNPGHFTKDLGKLVSDAEWGSDQYPLSDSELSYALGKDGSTRRKLSRASGCIMEYVGHIAFLAGTKTERARARDYLKWLLKQRNGPVRVEGLSDRDDVSTLRVPAECAGYITGNRGSTLRQIEEDTGTFCFLEGGNRGEDETLLVFGHDKGGRERAEREVRRLIDEKLSLGRGGGPRGPPPPPPVRGAYDDRYGGGDRYDRHDRYDRYGRYDRHDRHDRYHSDYDRRSRDRYDRERSDRRRDPEDRHARERDYEWDRRRDHDDLDRRDRRRDYGDGRRDRRGDHEDLDRRRRDSDGSREGADPPPRAEGGAAGQARAPQDRDQGGVGDSGSAAQGGDHAASVPAGEVGASPFPEDQADEV
mmetsp:Transcript_8560/g.29218  ORF Transcript_8560/g.29218 Transcript_8560/m.29218 type:complete len:584 (-) Transcript_8560:332-2083(-)